MITTHMTMDLHSLEIRRKNKQGKDESIGHIMWHDGIPKIVLNRAFEPITLSEIEQAKRDYEHRRSLNL